MPLKEVPLGTDVHNVELMPGKGGQMARSAGTSVAGRREGRRVRHAAHGQHGNAHGARQLHGDDRRGRQRGARAAVSAGKAGATRWAGKRPKVRGEVMNPVDHPHGGRTRGGRNVVSPWGKKEGVKTRNKKKASQRLHRARPEARQSHAVRFFKATSKDSDYGKKHSKRARSFRTAC